MFFAISSSTYADETPNPIISSLISNKPPIASFGNFSLNAFSSILYSGWNSDLPNICKLS